MLLCLCSFAAARVHVYVNVHVSTASPCLYCIMHWHCVQCHLSGLRNVSV